MFRVRRGEQWLPAEVGVVIDPVGLDISGEAGGVSRSLVIVDS
jgi:hypothetical protein